MRYYHGGKREQVEKLLDRGYRQHQIVNITGLTKQRVSKIALDRQTVKSRKETIEGRNQKILEYLSKMDSVTQISRLTGYDTGTIYNVARKHGIKFPLKGKKIG